ncbi:MAG: thioredoxin family protein, partial [Clostridiaceae bacterium]|nr:thioredoxin family protein [Clostridiaceae bacterium]
VFSIPTLFIFKNGKVVDQLVGARPYDEVARKLEKYID